MGDTYGQGTYGEGTYGGTAGTLKGFHVKSKTASTITLAWDPVTDPNVEGFLYFVNGKKVSRTFDPNVTQVKFGHSPGSTYEVHAIGFSEVASGKVTA